MLPTRPVLHFLWREAALLHRMSALPEKVVFVTLLAKLRQGVVEIATTHDCRYAETTLVESAYLIWTFRNFRRLPAAVLSQRQRRILERLAHAARADVHVAPHLVIGRVEFVHWPRCNPRPPAVAHPRVPATHSRIAVHRGNKPIRTLPIWRTSLRSKYALYALSAGLILGAGTMAGQRLWTKQARSTALAGKTDAMTSRSAPPPSSVREDPLTSTSSQPAGSGTRVAAPMIDSALPLPRLPVKTRETSFEDPSNRSTKALDRSALPNAEQRFENTRPQVLLAPRRVIYPVLPASTRLKETNGSILVKTIVNSDGTVNQVLVPGQDRSVAAAVVKTVQQWRYRPYLFNGQAVEVETHMVFTVLGEDAISVRFLPPETSLAKAIATRVTGP
jgi:hypothetical protein